uniref:Uncharacterized protein n=1 Tax=Anguilla anguilla TaxID=7936 RepID=A0A0E9UX87_ANGAN
MHTHTHYKLPYLLPRWVLYQGLVALLLLAEGDRLLRCSRRCFLPPMVKGCFCAHAWKT